MAGTLKRGIQCQTVARDGMMFFTGPVLFTGVRLSPDLTGFGWSGSGPGD